ncbi:MAG TPA: hypothetical protein VMB35_00125 [Methanomicrobiales archaeon]|nr:hypothetical protein [Methanomicrobiales archaeon]
MLSRGTATCLFLVFALLFFTLSCGCLSFGKSTGTVQATVTPTGTTIKDGTARGDPKVSLEDAMSSLPAAEQESGIDTKGMTLHQVFGYGVDSSGLARTWVLGMQGNGRTTLLSYTTSESEWKALDMPGIILPEGEVKVADLLSPQALFQNRKVADAVVIEMNRQKVSECDLTLGSDVYDITVHSDTDTETLRFSATTGEKVASP